MVDISDYKIFIEYNLIVCILYLIIMLYILIVLLSYNVIFPYQLASQKRNSGKEKKNLYFRQRHPIYQNRTSATKLVMRREQNEKITEVSKVQVESIEY